MSAQHTQGKVTVLYPCLYAADGRRILELEHGTTDELKRLAACWNACEGLSTEALERLGTLDKARVQLDVIRAEAIAQRDELLAVLVEAEDYLRNCANSPEMADKARAAIAKAAGGAP